MFCDICGYVGFCSSDWALHIWIFTIEMKKEIILFASYSTKSEVGWEKHAFRIFDRESLWLNSYVCDDGIVKIKG
jgi:hypothetical protein